MDIFCKYNVINGDNKMKNVQFMLNQLKKKKFNFTLKPFENIKNV